MPTGFEEANDFRDRLTDWLAEGEHERLEFKQAVPKNLADDIAGMANTAGGTILIGVTDKGEPVDVQTSNRLLGQIQDMAGNCDPPVNARASVLDGVIVIEVEESTKKPVQSKGGFFQRVGASTRKMKHGEVMAVFQQYPSPEYGSLKVEGFNYPDDMNWENYQDWLERAGLSTTQPAETMLRNIDVAEGSAEELAMKNAGAMFFAREPSRFCPDASVTCILFNGKERVKIIDRKDFSGGMLSDIEDTMNFIERNTRVAYEIKSLQRENIPAYPMEAVREALLNAVMHRDWYLTGANVHVEILSDRLEIKSPGNFPTGVTLETLGQAAVRRNPLVADLLGRVGLVERAGTGIERMRVEALSRGYPEPEFKEDTFVTVIFRQHPKTLTDMELRDRQEQQ